MHTYGLLTWLSTQRPWRNWLIAQLYGDYSGIPNTALGIRPSVKCNKSFVSTSGPSLQHGVWLEVRDTFWFLRGAGLQLLWLEVTEAVVEGRRLSVGEKWRNVGVFMSQLLCCEARTRLLRKIRGFRYSFGFGTALCDICWCKKSFINTFDWLIDHWFWLWFHAVDTTTSGFGFVDASGYSQQGELNAWKHTVHKRGGLISGGRLGTVTAKK